MSPPRFLLMSALYTASHSLLAVCRKRKNRHYCVCKRDATATRRFVSRVLTRPCALLCFSRARMPLRKCMECTHAHTDQSTVYASSCCTKRASLSFFCLSRERKAHETETERIEDSFFLCSIFLTRASGQPYSIALVRNSTLAYVASYPLDMYAFNTTDPHNYTLISAVTNYGGTSVAFLSVPISCTCLRSLVFLYNFVFARTIMGVLSIAFFLARA